MQNDTRLTFLYTSLSDIQSTIRATDTKVSYLLVAIFIPLTSLGSIYHHIHDVLTVESSIFFWPSLVIVALFVASWLFSFWLSMRTLISIENPIDHIKNNGASSDFYPASLFDFGFIDIVIKSKSMSKKSFQEHYQGIPTTEEKASQQLVLEQMKAIYIASIKTRRAKYAYCSALTWIGSGGAIWLTQLYLSHEIIA